MSLLSFRRLNERITLPSVLLIHAGCRPGLVMASHNLMNKWMPALASLQDSSNVLWALARLLPASLAPQPSPPSPDVLQSLVLPPAPPGQQLRDSAQAEVNRLVAAILERVVGVTVDNPQVRRRACPPPLLMQGSHMFCLLWAGPLAECHPPLLTREAGTLAQGWAHTIP